MALNAQIVRRVVAVALLAGAVGAAIRGVGGEPPRSEPALAANKCILCNSFGANQVPRICNTCNNKFSNKCILCNAFGANQVPRICNTCNSKY